MCITRSKAGEPATTTSPFLCPLSLRVSPLLAQACAGKGIDPQDKGSSQHGCVRDVPFSPLAEAHTLAACLIWWFCIFQCSLMWFHSLVAKQSPGWCVLSTGQSEPQHSAQKFTFCCLPLQDAPTLTYVASLQERGQSLRGKQMFWFKVWIFNFE